MRSAITIRPFREGDATAFEPRLDFRRELERIDFAALARAPGPTWTIVRHEIDGPGEVVGVGGFVRLDPLGAWRGFAILSHVPRGDWPQLMDCARDAIGRLERRWGAKLVAAAVREGFPAGRRVLERLGFSHDAQVSDWPGYRVLARRSQSADAA